MSPAPFPKKNSRSKKQTEREYWPVIHCNISSQGSVRIIGSQDEPLSQAFDAIARGNPPGHNPNFRRRAIRMAASLRVRIIQENKDIRRPGNIDCLCVGGCSVISYDPPQPGEVVHLEIWDMSDETQKCEARTIWTRRWEDSAQLPCASFSFDPGAASPRFKQAIADFLFDSFQKEFGRKSPRKT